jgi:hypothetical protein
VVELVTVRVPVSAPLVSGAKTTEMLQLAPATRVVPQVLVRLKLPAIVTALTVIEIALVLVSVKACAVERPPPA